jgi:hypothetical protein
VAATTADALQLKNDDTFRPIAGMITVIRLTIRVSP